jgi:class III poly(R)-hydroxyalkanoic acid synthase PhaE subunit
MKVQQQYWNQWQNFAQQASGAKPAKNPWEAAMDHWMQAIAPAQTDPSAAFLQKMVEQGKQFMNMGNQLMDQVKGAQDWSSIIEKTFGQSTQNPFSANHDAFEQMKGFWQSPLQAWQNMSANMPSPAQGFSGMGENPLSAFLQSPSLGYSREIEEKYKQWAQAGVEYQAAFMAYNAIFKDMPAIAIERMKSHVEGLQKVEKTIDSARELYDHWVGICEQVYSEIVMTPEYSKVHGELVNAQMRTKKIWGEIFDRKLAFFNMPTQREMRSLQAKLQESRRTVRSLQKEMAQFKKQLAELSAQAKAATAEPVVVAESVKVPAKKAAPKAAPKKASNPQPKP